MARREGRSALGQRHCWRAGQQDGADHAKVADTPFERPGRRAAPDYRPRRGILARLAHSWLARGWPGAAHRPAAPCQRKPGGRRGTPPPPAAYGVPFPEARAGDRAGPFFAGAACRYARAREILEFWQTRQARPGTGVAAAGLPAEPKPRARRSIVAARGGQGAPAPGPMLHVVARLAL